MSEREWVELSSGSRLFYLATVQYFKLLGVVEGLVSFVFGLSVFL